MVVVAAIALGVVLLGALAPDRTARPQDRAEEATPSSADAMSGDAISGEGTQVPGPAPRPPATSTPLPARPEPATPMIFPDSALTTALPQVDGVSELQAAPLGTYVVAREGAGVRWVDDSGIRSSLELPVYDEPDGDPRRLVDVNIIDGVEWSFPLVNWPSALGARVLRVIAGGPDDEWLIVQVPVRPNNSYAWVKRSDFDFGFTTRRIEIDLAGEGELTLIDSADPQGVILRSDIVHGKDSRPTPTHLTFLERGVLGGSVSPAYGTAILSMASFSESLGTFGGGGLPSNFIHGTNQPQLMGQRVSSGEIRMPNPDLESLIAEVTPGTPVLLFDSSEGLTRTAILEQPASPAATTALIPISLESPPVDGTSGVFPHLWLRCGSGQSGQTAGTAETGAMLCRSGPIGSHNQSTVYLEAKPDAGVEIEGIAHAVIPVYDEPGGEPRMLVDRNAIDQVGLRMPLQNPNRYGGPVVLWPIDATLDGEWFRVQAPVRPNRSAIWVRAADFEIRTNELRIEIDLARDGSLTLYDGTEVVVANGIVSGKENRPTALGVSRIDKIIRGDLLSPAYGSYVAAYPIFSETLGTFGGAGAPNQAIHGTNQPELIGQKVSSGNIRVENEVMTFLVEQDLLGAYVVVFDSSVRGRDSALTVLESQPWTAADTTEPNDDFFDIAVPLF